MPKGNNLDPKLVNDRTNIDKSTVIASKIKILATKQDTPKRSVGKPNLATL